MHIFSKHLSEILCCISKSSIQDDRQDHNMHTLYANASVVSVNLPPSTVPQISNERDSLKAKALQEIFNSSSSVRGYIAAAGGDGGIPDHKESFDTQIYSCSQSPSRRQPRFERVAQHIKQRLSESRFSKTTSRSEVSPVRTNHKTNDLSSFVDELQQLTPHSTAMSSLLQQHTVSQGGYDSDAKPIASPFLNSCVRNHNRDFITIQAKVDHEAEHDDTNTTGQITRDLQFSQEEDNVPPTAPPSTPTGSSFFMARRLVEDKSPSQILCGFNSKLVRGALSLPSTPELKATFFKDELVVADECLLSLPGNDDVSGAGDLVTAPFQKLDDALKYIEREKETSIDGKNRLSDRIQCLEPSLLEFMAKCSKQSLVQKGISVSESPVETSDLSKIKANNDDRGMETCLSSPASSKSSSLHLFNMRISQRLGSNPQMPVLSPSGSRYSSLHSLSITSADDLRYRGRASNVGGRLSWITIEHNRRPSDPETRRLFENNGVRNNPPINWKGADLTDQVKDQRRKGSQHSHVSSENGSSCVLSDADFTEKADKRITRYGGKKSKNNPNSIAIGGRSASIDSSCLPRGCKRQDVFRESTHPWLPKQSTTNEARQANKEADPEYFDSGIRDHIESNESRSKMSLMISPDRRNETMSEVDTDQLAERRNEMLSEISTEISNLPTQDSASDGSAGASRTQQKQKLEEQPLQVCPLEKKSHTANSNSTNSDTERQSESRSLRRSRSMDDILDILKTTTNTRGNLLDRERSLPTLTRVNSVPGDRSTDEKHLGMTAFKPKHDMHNNRSRLLSVKTPRVRKHLNTRTTYKAWSRFPSHLRFVRCGSAGEKDGIKTRDFYTEKDFSLADADHFPYGSPKSHSTTSLQVRHLSAWNLLRFAQALSKRNISKTLPCRKKSGIIDSSLVVGRSERPGFIGHCKGLYNRSTSDFRTLAKSFGHKSDISVGTFLEYPEAQDLAGVGMFKAVENRT